MDDNARRELNATLHEKAEALAAYPKDSDGPLYRRPAPLATEQVTAPTEPARRLPTPNTAQSSSGSGAGATPRPAQTAADKAAHLRLHSAQRY